MAYVNDMYDVYLRSKGLHGSTAVSRGWGTLGTAPLAYRRFLQKKFSLHSPAGPVSLLASAQFSSAVENAFALEHAIDEVPWRHELITPFEVVEKGILRVPDGPGLGCELNWDVVLKRGEKYDPF